MQISIKSALCGCFLVTIACGQETSNDAPRSARAQGETSLALKDDAHPLKSADTSSPRDTLLGFMADVDRLYAEWKEENDIQSAAGYQTYSRARSVLDFTATPDGGSRFIQDQRMLMLREILNRLDIPPDNEIPGAKEVAENGVTQWTVPNTSITIQRIGDCLAPGTIATAVYSGHRAAREMDAAVPGDVPFRRE